MSRTCELRALGEFGRRLRSLRRLLGFDCREFAAALDLELHQLYQFELGERQPKFRVLRRIAELTTCDLDFLITGKTYGRAPARYGLSDEWMSYYGHVIAGKAPAGSAWYWECDHHHRVTMTCRPSQDCTTPNGIIGFTRWEYAGVNPLEDEHWTRHIRSLEARLPIERFVYRGRNRFIKISGKPAFDGTGAFLGYRGYAAQATVEEAVADWRLSLAV